jgi:hypothetical protein
MTARHAKTEYEPSTHADDARRLAESVAASLDKEALATASLGARLVSEGLAELCGGDRMIASKVAMAFAKLISMMAKVPVEDAGRTIDNTVTGYSLASGHLAGGYVLPETPEQEERFGRLLDYLGIDKGDLAHDEPDSVPGLPERNGHDAIRYI